MRIAVIGFGRMGWHHYRILRGLPGVEVAAVCDSMVDGNDVPEPLYKELDDLLDHVDIDAAIVSVPTICHKETAISLANHGIDFLIEKPIAQTVDEALEIMAAVSANGVNAVVGHVERFNPVVRSLMQELTGKDIYSISITRVGPFPPRIKDVGILVDLSVHDIDLVRLLTQGAAIQESRIFKSVKINGRHEDNAVITFRFANDTVATIITNWLTPFKKRMIEVAASTAYYEADLITQELKEYSAYKEDNSYLVRDCEVQKNEPLENELVAFIDFLKTGERGCLATIDDGIRTLELIHRRRMQTV